MLVVLIPKLLHTLLPVSRHGRDCHVLASLAAIAASQAVRFLSDLVGHAPEQKFRERKRQKERKAIRISVPRDKAKENGFVLPVSVQET